MFTLTNTINYINQALNYPSASFTDLKLFIDQAISELNTALHIGIRSIDEIINDNRQKVSLMDNIVILQSAPDNTTTILVSDTEPSDVDYYYNSTTQKYGKKLKNIWTYFDTLYGIYNNYIETPKTYKALQISSDIVIWIMDIYEDPLDVNLLDYFTKDWIMLFIIPYVCFKYSIRDGDSGVLFSEEFSQGFQQLNNNYNIPATVNLISNAGKLPYTKDVLANIENLNIKVPTRAITEDMRIPREISASYEGLYDKGGFGL